MSSYRNEKTISLIPLPDEYPDERIGQEDNQDDTTDSNNTSFTDESSFRDYIVSYNKKQDAKKRKKLPLNKPYDLHPLVDQYETTLEETNFLRPSLALLRSGKYDDQTLNFLSILCFMERENYIKNDDRKKVLSDHSFMVKVEFIEKNYGPRFTPKVQRRLMNILEDAGFIKQIRRYRAVRWVIINHEALNKEMIECSKVIDDAL